MVYKQSRPMIPGLGHYFCLRLLIRSESACLPASWHEAAADMLACCCFSLLRECSEIGHQGNYSVPGAPP